MGEEIKSHCGIFLAHSLHDVYKGLKALQHRGQDCAGIAVKHKRGIDILRWTGLVDELSLESIGKILPQGEMYIGHVRYSTMKGKDEKSLFLGAHPRFIDGEISLDNSNSFYPHVVFRHASKAIVHNGHLSDLQVQKGKIDTDLMLEFYSEKGIENVLRNFEAAYSAIILDLNCENSLVFRDRYGIRPLWIGEKDGNIIASSEDIAIWDIGGRPIREVMPGEIISIPELGTNFTSQRIFESKERFCFFCNNYLASLSSSFNGLTVSKVRYSLGVELAKEFHLENIDFVSYVPHSPKEIARGYSDFTGLDLVEIFYKAKKGRSFLESTQIGRKKSINENLFILDNVDLKNKRLIIFDDSLVRGNVAENAVKKLRDKGVDWIAWVLGTPPLGPVVDGIQRGCLYGVDMPPEDDFAMKIYGNIEGIKKFIGVDELYFISLEGMARAHRASFENLCTYCIGGPKPTI